MVFIIIYLAVTEMSEKLFTIGEVSKITGVSKDTLRFYDKIGLFQPKYVDEKNNYRYYTVDQFWYIDIITCCRRLGVSLERIKELVDSKDNAKIVEMLEEQREKALQLSQYYMRADDDIAWYGEQNRKILNASKDKNIRIEHFEERKVIFGVNPKDESAYHIALQEACREEILHLDSIKRNYGYFLKVNDIFLNTFHKTGEFIDIGIKEYKFTQPENIFTIPDGTYACFITEVCNQHADFSPLIEWLEKNNKEIDFVIAEEIGLQLFYYSDSYLCEIKALLKQ
jgi:MerR family transcriptional activator of bmr gene